MRPVGAARESLAADVDGPPLVDHLQEEEKESESEGNVTINVKFHFHCLREAGKASSKRCIFLAKDIDVL